MGSIIKQIKLLYENEFYSSVIRICDMSLTIFKQKPDYFSPNGNLQVILYYADSLYHIRQFQQAETLYRQALQLQISRKEFVSKNYLENDYSNETDIKYKIYSCCLALGDRSAAAKVLELVPAKERTVKINMALGNIYMKAGMKRLAITCFKEVVKECPMAVEAMENLVKLGIKSIDINTLIIEVSSEVPWLVSWLTTQSYLYNKEFENAKKSFTNLDSHGLSHMDNALLVVDLGYCYHYLCEDEKAISLLQRAININPNLTYGRDLLSTLLAHSEEGNNNKEHQRSLENLTSKLQRSLWSAEDWIVLGNLMYFLKNYERATYFGQQACIMNNSRCKVEAFFLKASSLLQLEKYHDAAAHCNEALQLCPIRYDLYKCLVDCYLNSDRILEAEAVAARACNELNPLPHPYCLQALCILKGNSNSTSSTQCNNKKSSQKECNINNLKQVLKQACSLDSTGKTNAVYMMTELLIREEQFEEAIELLLKAIENHLSPTSRHFQLLGDCYKRVEKYWEAFENYTTALRLNPLDQRATEGLNDLDLPPNMRNKDQCFNCIDEVGTIRKPNSDHEGDGESDTDMWPSSVDLVHFDN